MSLLAVNPIVVEKSLYTLDRVHVVQASHGCQLATALSEWLFFGAYVIRQGVSARCRENAALRDAILKAFFDQMYAGLRRAGVKESDLPRVEDWPLRVIFSLSANERRVSRPKRVA